MRATLLGVTILGLLALPATAEPLVLPAHPGPAPMQPIDFDLLKQAEKQSQQEQDEAAKRAAEDAARKAQADKATADKAQTDKAAADKAAADKAAADKAAFNRPPAPPPPTAPITPSAPITPAAPMPLALTAHVPVKLATGSAAGSAELTETSDKLHVLLNLANIPAGRYRLMVLPLPECGKPFAAPSGPAQAIPTVTAGPDGAIAAAFTVRHQMAEAAGNGVHWPVLALYPADAKPGAGWLACGVAAR